MIATAVAAPLAAASTTAYDLVYVSGPTANAGNVTRGQTPFADFTFQNVGPGVAPTVNVTFSLPSANNNPAATLNQPNNGVSAGWTLVDTFSADGRDFYTYQMTNVPVGQQTVRWSHVVGGSAQTSYTINALRGAYAEETDWPVRSTRPGPRPVSLRRFTVTDSSLQHSW